MQFVIKFLFVGLGVVGYSKIDIFTSHAIVLGLISIIGEFLEGLHLP